MSEELTKLPTESVVFDMDFTDQLATGDTITALASTTFVNNGRIDSSTDIVIGTTSFTTTKTQVRITVGQQHEQYEIIATVTTANGNTLIGKGLLRIL